MIALVAGAWAQVVLPIREIDHPKYVDALDQPLTWAEVRDLARPTGALGQVARRRAGRTLVRATFLAATALEVWGTYELARRDSWVALPLGVQAGFTGVCALLSFTNAPNAQIEDRGILIDAVNRPRPSPSAPR